MNPLRQDDPRHRKAVDAAWHARWDHKDTTTDEVIAAYHESLKEQGVVLIEAYAGDDAQEAGRVVVVYVCGFCPNVVAEHALAPLPVLPGVEQAVGAVVCRECPPGYHMRREVFDLADSKTRAAQ